MSLRFFIISFILCSLIICKTSHSKEIKSNKVIHTLTKADKKYFFKNIDARLFQYLEYFMIAGVEYDLDWRLLAAMAYQESHWNEKATSKTGVKGLMMLTKITAKEMNINDRKDPIQSITGGAKYIKLLMQRLPSRIQQPNRLWMALAAYNMGYGHLEDARVLTDRQDDNPDFWLDVKQRLPLLQNKLYHSTLKHGHARGNEAKTYVARIRAFYDILRWYYPVET